MRGRLARAMIFAAHLPMIAWFRLTDALGRWVRRSRVLAFFGETFAFLLHLPVIAWLAAAGAVDRWVGRSRLLAFLERVVAFLFYLPVRIWRGVARRMDRWASRSRILAWGRRGFWFIGRLLLIGWLGGVGLWRWWASRSKVARLARRSARMGRRAAVGSLSATAEYLGVEQSREETYYYYETEEADAPAGGRRKRPLWLRVLLGGLRLAAVFVLLVFGFLADWIRSRGVRQLLWGLPSVLAFTAIVSIAWVGWRQRSAEVELAARYAEAGAEALEEKQYERATLMFQKLAYLDESDSTGKYGLALTALAQGDLEQARQLMKAIAPEEGKGDARAHFWLAKDLVRSNKQLSPEAAKVLEHHLLQTVAEYPANAEAQRMLGQLYASRKQYRRAARHMAVAAKQRPELALTLARIKRLAGDESGARRAAEGARDRYALQAKAAPGDVEARLMWADAEYFLKEYEATKEVLFEGLRFSSDARLRQAIVKLYLGRFDALRGAGGAQSNPTRAVALLPLLEVALHYGAGNVGALRRLMAWLDEEGKDPKTVRSLLTEALASGQGPAVAHLLLGLLATEQGKPDVARLHLEQARRLEPAAAAILNNLATVASQVEPAQLDRARTAVEAALSLDPNRPEILATRGQILFRMERYDESARDLEAAVEKLSDRPALRLALAAVYEKLGDAERAAQQRRLAETLRAPAAAKKQTDSP